MGFAANQAVLMGIIAREHDLQLESIIITQQKMYLSNLTSGLFNQQATLDPNSQASKLLEARIRQLSEADKLLDIQLKRINGQLDALKEEKQTIEKYQKDNVKSFGMS